MGKIGKHMGGSIEELKSVISDYLDLAVKKPVMETVEADFDLQDRLAEVLNVLAIVERQIVEEDPRRLNYSIVQAIQTVARSSEETASLNEMFRLLRTQGEEKTVIRTIYLSYLRQLFHWTTISILSASYISAFVLIRTLLELLINASAPETDGMSRRLHSIQYLTPDERDQITRDWHELSGWAHPYGRWLNEACPVFVSMGQHYHPKLARTCTEKLQACADLALAIAIEVFGASAERVLDMCKEQHVRVDPFSMLLSRATQGKDENFAPQS